jgi:hypothetical protein
VDGEDLLAAAEVGRGDEDLAVEAAGAEQLKSESNQYPSSFIKGWKLLKIIISVINMANR